MGLFDGFMTKRTLSLEVADAVALTGVCASMCDGDIDDQESRRLITLLFSHPFFSNDIDDPDAAVARLGRLMGIVKSAGIEGAVDTISGSLTPGLKETAFLWAFEVVSADGWISPAEKEFLENLVTRFAISPDVVRTIMYVEDLRYRTQ